MRKETEERFKRLEKQINGMDSYYGSMRDITYLILRHLDLKVETPALISRRTPNKERKNETRD